MNVPKLASDLAAAMRQMVLDQDRGGLLFAMILTGAIARGEPIAEGGEIGRIEDRAQACTDLAALYNASFESGDAAAVEAIQGIVARGLRLFGDWLEPSVKCSGGQLN